ncbi:winged helix-turn-helix transcriptional regulator [Enterobacteriaceae bacterium BIT-l23]|uniref:ArsR/SmtB family transcription factor n=1 Tax=Jejubacter sp. L23 TaxID=3092086 RepID=UPI001584A79D|nr:winged helix-turn-helix transcriptional regulator [Enterobacteriaceae bacterium BIT-l23]
MTLLTSPETQHQNATLEIAVSTVAAAMADPSRVRMLCALMDGRAWTATELSAVADIAPSTASAHLAKLMNGRLILCLSQGRYRYYRLTGSEVAGLIENMMGVSWQRFQMPETRTPSRLRQARTCYDHLAGEAAVAIYRYMEQEAWIDAQGSALTEEGKRQFQRLGVMLDPQTRRKPCAACLDWSERRFHLGGDTGAALLLMLEQKGWITRTQGYREVTITREGASALRRLFRVELCGD